MIQSKLLSKTQLEHLCCTGAAAIPQPEERTWKQNIYLLYLEQDETAKMDCHGESNRLINRCNKWTSRVEIRRSSKRFWYSILFSIVNLVLEAETLCAYMYYSGRLRLPLSNDEIWVVSVIRVYLQKWYSPQTKNKCERSTPNTNLILERGILLLSGLKLDWMILPENPRFVEYWHSRIYLSSFSGDERCTFCPGLYDPSNISLRNKRKREGERGWGGEEKWKRRPLPFSFCACYEGYSNICRYEKWSERRQRRSGRRGEEGSDEGGDDRWSGILMEKGSGGFKPDLFPLPFSSPVPRPSHFLFRLSTFAFLVFPFLFSLQAYKVRWKENNWQSLAGLNLEVKDYQFRRQVRW